MAKQGYGNFAFLFEKDPVTYTDMLELESQLRLNYRWTGLRIRGALEVVLQKVAEKHGLQAQIPEDLLFSQKLLKLLDHKALSLSRPVLPCAEEIVTFTIPGTNGISKTAKDTCYNFLNKLGNAFRDGQDPPAVPETSYPNTVLAMRLLHKILKALYEADSAPDFDPDQIPYGPFIPDATDEAADVLQGCDREVWAHSVNEAGQPEQYALLRVYRVDGKHAPRRQQLELRLQEVRKATIRCGLPVVTALNPHVKDSPFLILAYIFRRDVRMLSNRLLETLELPERLKLCKFLVESLHDLHKAPLYHGSLDPTCVYIARVRARLAAWVTKFDCTPFTPDLPLQDLGPEITGFLGRYITPERGLSDLKTDPARADVYSLGVLLGDIVYGKLTNDLPATVFFHVSRMPIPVPLGRIIGEMCNKQPQLRPTMAQVMEVFSEVIP